MMDSMSPKKAAPWAAAVAGAVMALSAPQAALAGGKAYASLTYENFLFVNQATGDALVLGTDILVNQFAGTVAHLVGPPVTADNGFDFDITDGVGIDVAQTCVGICTKGENDFSMGDFNADEYRRADSLVAGSGINVGLGDDPATVSTVGELITQTGLLGSQGESGYLSGTNFNFIALADMTVELRFDASADVWGGIHVGANGIANAATSIVFNLDDVTAGADLVISEDVGSLSDLNLALTQAGPGTDMASNSGSFVLSATLIAGHEYDFTIDTASTVNLTVQKIPLPEPGTVALLGLGLVGIAVGGRRRRLV